MQRGTLKRAKILVAGTALCRVRTLYDENGKQLNEASPGNPVEVTGWRDELPGAGEQILELDNEVSHLFYIFVIFPRLFLGWAAGRDSFLREPIDPYDNPLLFGDIFNCKGCFSIAPKK